MDSNTLNLWQWRIRQGIQRVQREYYRYPWIFMTESDIQCTLYSSLLSNSFIKARKTIIRDRNDKRIYENESCVLTRPIHSELSFSRHGGSGYVDLSLFDPSDIEFWVKSTKFDRTEDKFPIYDWHWEPSEAIGIEIKFNRWILKTDAYSFKTNRERKTKRWLDYRSSLVEDLKKLRQYKRGWLVFVDQHTLFDSKKDWKDFVDGIIRDSNYGWAKKTLNAYYLAPGFKKALSFKASYESF